MSIDIAAVVNLHDEGPSATPSLVSAWRAVEAASAHDLTVQLVLVLDRPDEPTQAVAQKWARRGAHIVSCDEGDLGAARNAAVHATDASYVAFLDADDLWSENWLTEAMKVAVDAPAESLQVFHPDVNVIFGDHHSLLFHRASTDPSFRRARLRLHNMWTALCFVRRDVLLQFPYPRNELATGFGFEDWSWNLAVYDAGGEHHIVADTCHFIRRTDSGSLLGASQSALRTPYPSQTETTATATRSDVSELTPTDDDLPATHRRLPHDLSPVLLEQVGLATSIEPAVAKTITRDGYPRTIAQNRNDHVTNELRALEAAEQLRSTLDSLNEVVDQCQTLLDLPRASRDRVIAELVLGEVVAGRPLAGSRTGPVAEAVARYPQLRGLAPAESA